MSNLDIKNIDLLSYLGLQSTDLRIINLMQLCQIDKSIKIKRGDISFAEDAKKLPIGFSFKYVEETKIKNKNLYPEGCIVLSAIFIYIKNGDFFTLPNNIAFNDSKEIVFSKINKEPVKMIEALNGVVWSFGKYEIAIHFSNDNTTINRITLQIPFFSEMTQ